MDQLAASIKEQLAAGKSPVEITNALYAKGYTEEVILLALAKLADENHPKPLSSRPLTRTAFTYQRTIRPAQSFPLLGLLSIIIVLVMSIGGIAVISAQTHLNTESNAQIIPTTEILPSPTQSPYDTLQQAAKKTAVVESVMTSFTSLETTEVTQLASKNTITVNSHVDGYVSFAQSGTTEQDEVKIYSDATPSQLVTTDTIRSTTGDVYIRATGESHWIKLSASQLATASATPSDASLYGISLLAGLFDTHTPLFAGLDPTNIQDIGITTVNTKQLHQYTTTLLPSRYLTALNQATTPLISATDKHSAAAILANAQITIDWYVNPQTGYVEHLRITATHLRQIQPDSTKNLLTATHDISETADISQVNTLPAISLPLDVMSSDQLPIISPSPEKTRAVSPISRIPSAKQ